MFLPDLVIRSRRVVTPNGMRPAAIHLRHQRIIGVVDFDDVPEGCPVDETDPAVLLPGIVDTNVHVEACAAKRINGFAAATRAAAAGGVTTIVDAPSGAGAATSVATLEARRQLAQGNCWVDVGFRAGILPGQTAELRPMFEAGVLAFECALIPDAGPPPLTERDLRTVMPGLRHIGALLAIHAESPADTGGIARAIDLCREYQTATHLVHLSSSAALTPLFHGRAARLPLTAETCPHYLNLVVDEVPAAALRSLRHAPPIRERENREFLWAALAHGLVQSISADRFTPLDRSLPLVWMGAHGRGYGIDRLADWMSAAPARWARLSRKGRIEVGYDADLVVFDPDAEPAPHDHDRLHGRRRPRGAVDRTYLRGALIYSRRDGWVGEPRGRCVERGA